MRYTGLLLLCAPTALAGAMYAAAIKKRSDLCLLLAALLNDTARFISETGTDICKAMKYVSQKRKYAAFDFPNALLRELSDGRELQTAWKECAMNSGGISSLLRDEREIFLAACECFDSSTSKEVSKRLAEHAALLTETAREESTRFAKNGGAAAGLSFLGAAALFIILV